MRGQRLSIAPPMLPKLILLGHCWVVCCKTVEKTGMKIKPINCTCIMELYTVLDHGKNYILNESHLHTSILTLSEHKSNLDVED